MIPILYDAAETAYTTQGLGRLPDAISCVVEEERNGAYTLTMRYPVTGLHFDEIALNRQIMAAPAYGKDPEPFRVVRITRPLDGVVTVEANHISYDLKTVTVAPFTAADCAGAFTAMQAAAMDALPFTFWTNKDVVAAYKSVKPAAVRSLLGGESNSFLDVFGTGEYEFTKRQVKLWLHRGSDKGVSIRYGKNLTAIEAITDADGTFASVVPYWESMDGDQVVIGTKITSGHESEFPAAATIPLNLSESFEEAPTVAQLNARATAYLTNNEPWEISQNLTVSFVNLADTEEYKDVASLQAVNLCDTVHVVHPGLGVSVKAKVIRTQYDVLLERYEEIELGKPRTSLKQAIDPVTKTELSNQITQSSNWLMDSMEEMVGALFGVDGGHIKFVKAADGHISEIYAMDTDDEATAVNVLRINYQGIYCSTNGINGTYNLAISTGGTINASQVLTGTLRAIEISNGNGTFHVSSAGELEATAGSIGGWDIGSTYLIGQTMTTADNEQYRVHLQPPQADGGTWVLSVEKYTGTGWLPLAYIRMDGKVYCKDLQATGNASVTGNAVVGKAVTIGETLGVIGKTTLQGGATIQGALTLSDDVDFGSSGTWKAGGTYRTGNIKMRLMTDASGNYVYCPCMDAP